METEEFLGNVGLFKGLNKEALSYLATKLSEVSFPEGQALKKGESSFALFIIKSGSAKVTTSDSLGRMEATLAHLQSGDSFGELGLIDGIQRSADVTALTNMNCYMLSRSDFLAALEEYPEIAKSILPCLTAMVRSANNWINTLFNTLANHGTY